MEGVAVCVLPGALAEYTCWLVPSNRALLRLLIVPTASVWEPACNCAQVRHAEALKEMDRHQDSYMRREELLKAQLAALTQPQDETAESTGASAGGSSTATQSSSGVCNEPSSAADGTVAFSSGAAAQRGQKLQQPLTLQDMQQQVMCRAGNTDCSRQLLLVT